MNILLWITLIGVIVFLLALFYSRFNRSAASQPATKTISPAIAPTSSPAPAPASPLETKPKTDESKKSVAVEAVAKSVPDIQPKAVATPAVEKSAPAKSPAPAAKIIPAAEPVGPAHSKPSETPITTATAVPARKSADKSAAPAAPTPAAEPERLKKPRNDKADDLTKITGIGKAIQSKLFSAGIFHYNQLTDLSALQTAWLDNVIGFKGRYERENWGAQAKKLTAKSSATTANAPKRTPKPAKAAAAKTKTVSKPKAKPAKKTTSTL